MAAVLQAVRKRLLEIEDLLPGGAVFGGRERLDADQRVQGAPRTLR